MLLSAPPTWQSAGDIAPLTVVLDVLRWSTTVLTALHHGAERVEAFATPEQARARAAELGDALLAGERDSHRIPGFDLGNSPLEFTRAAVQGRVVLSTTTNGTQALLAAQRAERVLIGAFVNLGCIVAESRAALVEGRGVTLLCAGQLGEETLEDSACAGAVVHALRGDAALDHSLFAPNALRAESLWVEHGRSVQRVFAASAHAQALRGAGFSADLAAAADIDALPLVGVATEARMIRRGVHLAPPQQ